MAKLFFISHPEVVIDPVLPVPRWHLADAGIHRMRALSAAAVMADVQSVWASTETKAIEAAGILAAARGLPVQIEPTLGENDRSATGYLPKAEFEAMADAFFANPAESVQGWERAIDAQRRIQEAVGAIIAQHRHGDLAIVAHGGVGTLLLCAWLGVPISRERDQSSQGNLWSFDLATRRVLQGWRPF